MNVADFLRGKRPETRQADNFTDAIVALLLERAEGPTEAKVSGTGALEAASGIVGRAFASAAIGGASPLIVDALTPDLLMFIGRAFLRAGESVFAIDTSMGMIDLLPAHTWDISGGPNPRTWRYHLQMPGPSGDMNQELPYAGVLHFRYSVNPSRPHVGIGPLSSGNIAAKLSANVNAALADETGMPRGAILPMSDEPSDKTTDFEGKLAKLRGRIITMQTNRGNVYDRDSAPRKDWEANRIGAAPPPALVQLRTDADKLLMAACGIPTELIEGGDGSALRESYRRLLFSTIQPLGAVVQTELRLKLEAPELVIDWSELRAADIASRARAFGSLVKGGLSKVEAAKNTGIQIGDNE